MWSLQCIFSTHALLITGTLCIWLALHKRNYCVGCSKCSASFHFPDVVSVCSWCSAIFHFPDVVSVTFFYGNVYFFFFVSFICCQFCNLRNDGTRPHPAVTTEQTHFGKLVAILSASSDIIWVFSLNFAVICYDLWVDAMVDCDAAHGGHACRQAIAGTLQGASLWLRSITTDHFTSGSSVQRAASRSSYVFFWSIDPVKLCASGAVLVYTAKPSS